MPKYSLKGMHLFLVRHWMFLSYSCSAHASMAQYESQFDVRNSSPDTNWLIRLSKQQLRRVYTPPPQGMLLHTHHTTTNIMLSLGLCVCIQEAMCHVHLFVSKQMNLLLCLGSIWEAKRYLRRARELKTLKGVTKKRLCALCPEGLTCLGWEDVWEEGQWPREEGLSFRLPEILLFCQQGLVIQIQLSLNLRSVKKKNSIQPVSCITAVGFQRGASQAPFIPDSVTLL